MKKSLKKLFAIALAAAMVMALCVSAGAVNITINRDTTYDADATGNREFTYYKVFSADYDENTSTGGGYDEDGTPGAVNASTDTASYTASAAVAAKLGTWADGKWTKATGNLWFDLEPIAGTTNYSVTWANDASDTDTVQAAAQWLFANEVYEGSGSLTPSNDGTVWTATVDPGYYIIESSEGQNLVAATTDITINEKNSYPTIDKTQKDEDLEDYQDDPVNVAVGDVIDYQVKVSVPADADADIVVTDTMSQGLTYNNDLVVKVNGADPAEADGAEGTPAAGTTWTYTIHPTAATKGNDVIFTFTATVNASALVDTGKQNEVLLDYNNGHYQMPDKVEYTIYYAGIFKFDADTKDPMGGVKFTLTEGDSAFNVTKDENGYYVPGGTSNEVVTDENGYIIIRGLDKDKTYSLTETETLTGYNLLASPVTLNLYEDKDTSYTATDTYGQVENKKGATLPSTGGIGTKIFYGVGAVLVVGAVVLLVSRKRASN